MCIQAFFTERPVERLQKRIVRRLAWLRIIHSHPVFVGPSFHLLGDEVASVVGLYPLQNQVPAKPKLLQYNHHVATSKGLSHHDRQTLPTAVINYSQGAETAAVKQRIAHKAHAPNLMRSQTQRAYQAMRARFQPARTIGAKDQPLLLVDTINTLVIVHPALPTQ